MKSKRIPTNQDPMKLSHFYRPGRCGLSFELFPPKPEGFESLYENVQRLTSFRPDFFTCTYGAGGSSQKATMDVVQRVREITGCPVASHLTCVGSTIDDLRSYLGEAARRGVSYIVALRGDPPKGTTEFKSVAGGLKYANELVELIRSEFDFGILVAGYPEVHQEAPNAEVDMVNLKRKVDSGADVIVTQLFYDNQDFYRFRDACEAAGIVVPIVPGILPVTNFAQAQRIASMCKARIPKDFSDAMNENESTDWQFKIGVEHARQQTIDLLENDVPGLHYYILNKSTAAEAMLEGLELGAVS